MKNTSRAGSDLNVINAGLFLLLTEILFIIYICSYFSCKTFLVKLSFENRQIALVTMDIFLLYLAKYWLMCSRRWWSTYSTMVIKTLRTLEAPAETEFSCNHIHYCCISSYNAIHCIYSLVISCCSRVTACNTNHILEPAQSSPRQSSQVQCLVTNWVANLSL